MNRQNFHGPFHEQLASDLGAMQPGDRLAVDGQDLDFHIGSREYRGVRFTPADRVLEDIIGAGYIFSYRVDEASGVVTFERHKDTGVLHYRSPDRRGV